jgi:sulfane dehydrogenase subunit SoxC
MVHGLVNRPLIFTMDELKRFPSVTRFHFIECAGNNARASHKTVQQSHGLTSTAAWTGVPLSTLLKEAGVQSGAVWIVAEGADSPHLSRSVPLTKVMEDAMVAMYQNGERIQPGQGYPMRLMVPGYEGIFQVKYLRRDQVVDRYWTYNDYGHRKTDPKESPWATRLGQNR